jgi:hypothetical protein
MANASAVLSLGLFGRLSAAAAPRQDVLDRISSVRKERIRRYSCSESLRPTSEEILVKAFPLLLKELSNLVESLVLADTIIEFQGYDSAYIKTLADKNMMLTSSGPGSWNYTLVWPEEANRLWCKALDSVAVESAVISDPLFYDVEIALQAPSDAWSFSIMNHTLADGEFDHDCFRGYFEEWEPGSYKNEQAGWNKLKEYVDRKLGPDWITYRSAVDISEFWPNDLAALPRTFVREISEEHLHWRFKVGLYAELCAAMARGTVSVSGLAAGNYYQLLAGKDNLDAHLRRIVSTKYGAILRAKLEEVGYLCLDLDMPSILRLSVSGAETIDDVIDRALELRTHPWFSKLRGYLFELSCEERPEKLLRVLSRLQEHIETSIAGLSATVTTGLGISTTGSLSLSLPTVGKKLLSWLNPVVYVHSRISKTLGYHDSVADLERVLRLSRSEVVTLLRTVDLLN